MDCEQKPFASVAALLLGGLSAADYRLYAGGGFETDVPEYNCDKPNGDCTGVVVITPSGN
jgi:hypothetical protein